MRVAVVPADDAGSIARAVDAIRRGEIVAVPTETVYGLACALTDAALDRLLAAKGRPASKGITLLADSLAQVEALAEGSDPVRWLAARFWPGPLTLLLPPRPGTSLPETLTGGQPGVGFRLPDHPVPRDLARALGPLPLTSANVSGRPDATDAGAVVGALGSTVSIVLDGGPSSGGIPSTVVAALDRSAEPVVLRQGPIPEDALRSVISEGI